MKTIELRDYFKTNVFKMFDKVFLCRSGSHCGWIISLTPFWVKHYRLLKARLVLVILDSFRPILIEEYQIMSIEKYLENPPSNHFRDRPNESDKVQYPAWVEIVETEMQVRKFLLKYPSVK